MLRFLADENFNNQIVRGIFRRNSNVDIVHVQDVDLSEADDPTVRTILNRQRWNAGFSIITEANTNGGMRVSASASKNVRSIDDPTVLEWAAEQRRVVLTHDVATMTDFAYKRVKAGLSMPGLFEVSRRVPVGLAIEEILLLAECSLEGEWDGQVRFLPLR